MAGNHQALKEVKNHSTHTPSGKVHARRHRRIDQSASTATLM
jgi:hypothetical protein